MLVMAVAVVLFCVYLLVKRKRSSLNASIPTIQDGNTSLGIRTVSSRGGHAEEHQGCDGFPPRYSTVDHPPPPYSLVCRPCALIKLPHGKRWKSVYLTVRIKLRELPMNCIKHVSVNADLVMQSKTTPVSQNLTFSFIFSIQ